MSTALNWAHQVCCAKFHGLHRTSKTRCLEGFQSLCRLFFKRLCSLLISRFKSFRTMQSLILLGLRTVTRLCTQSGGSSCIAITPNLFAFNIESDRDLPRWMNYLSNSVVNGDVVLSRKFTESLDNIFI